MDKLFASRGVHSTIITTPVSAPAKGVYKSIDLGFRMSVKTLEFPKVDGLPEDYENVDQLPSPAMLPVFFATTKMLKDQLEQLLEEYRPSCLVADLFFPWAKDPADKFNIPSQLPPEAFTKIIIEAKESEFGSHGVIVNSFYEIEPEYADHYRNVLNRKTWHIGPLSLCNRSFEEKAQRGKQAATNEDECLKWLNSKSPNSVLYVCFGSVSKFPNRQLHEIAIGLEASEQQFIWVVRKGTNDKETEDWMPEGFEERMKAKGLIIRGWAPQMLILDHEAIGGFVTHCGWNSTLEDIAAGLPMGTWPLFAEQFYNEKLITDVLQIGVAVGAMEWVIGI
ncbi:hypothetical protein AgCh_030296 [Apium graveolens]